ncbi:MAG: 4Fe-4S dicluster domain-containing protein [Acidimicrobiia bacterium]|nr:4Fe-4S dicluster domain-containing protein [Acidimicrobiia bacterium]
MTEEVQDETESQPVNWNVFQLMMGLAASALVGTLLLWWLGTLSAEEHPEVGRAVFGNIPGPLVALFYVGVSVFIALSIYLFALRVKNYERGATERRSGLWKQRLKRFHEGVSMKTLLEDPGAGIMHSAIYYGFVVLFLGTVTLEIDHLLPNNLKFLHGGVYQVYSFILDLFAVIYLVGIGLAVARRYGKPPYRIRKTKAEDGWILATLGLIGITGLLIEAARISLIGRPSWEVWSFVGYPLSFLVPESIASGTHQVFWVAHAGLFGAFLVILPTTKLRHMITSPINLALSPRERPKGAMREMPKLLEATDLPGAIGASRVGEFTWKQLFDTDACTMCGRCTSVCPANTTGKALDPREIVLKLGEVATQTAADPVSPPLSMDGELTVSSDLVFERITSEELWACTTCRACDEICPVDIEIVDKILDMRRYLSLMESDFPSELGKAYINLENSSNVYGMAQANRADWTSQLNFEIKRLGPGITAEYLYWIGCAGSFDDRNVKVTVATAKLLHEAGIDFAILGAQELCTGDPARRTGNEYVFQGLALQNISTLNDLGITKIITQCPHCFNTIGNEYPQFGGDYEVIHHSELLMKLVDEGKVIPKSGGDQKVTFHDPCYLGRHNDVFIAPREVVGAVGELTEMPRNGTDSFCCGAGGGRMWMEEHVGKKVNIERAEEAVATGADVIATGCPFCYVMIDDGVKEIGRDDVQVKDLAILLAEQSLND